MLFSSSTSTILCPDSADIVSMTNIMDNICSENKICSEYVIRLCSPSVFNADDPPIIILAPKYVIARMAPCRHIFMTGLFIARIRSALVKSLHSSLETLLNFSVSYSSRT